MPCYVFESPEGRTLEMILPVEKRDRFLMIDGKTYKRRTVPDRLHVVTSSTPKAETQAENVLKGYRKKEEREGARFKSEFTKEQIKKAWKN